MKLLAFSLVFAAVFAAFGVMKTSNTHVATVDSMSVENTNISTLADKGAVQGVDGI